MKTGYSLAPVSLGRKIQNLLLNRWRWLAIHLTIWRCKMGATLWPYSLSYSMSSMPDMGPRVKNQYKGSGTPCMRGRPKARNTNTTSELDTVTGWRDNQLQTSQILLYYFYFYVKNDVYLTGMIATFIRLCHQFILFNFKFASKFANYVCT